MYVPLINYLVAKPSLNFNTIPELYTFLHSSDVNFKEHRSFILNILKDGLQRKEDFEVALRSMAFKLVLELYDSCLSEDATKLLILSILRSATRIPYAVDLLCSGYGLLTWLQHNVMFLVGDDVHKFLPVFLEILRNIIKNKTERVDIDPVIFIISYVLNRQLSGITNECLLTSIFETVSLIFSESSQFLNIDRLRKIVEHVNAKRCDYYLKYGAEFEIVSPETENNVEFFVRKITLDYLKLNRK